MKKALFAVLLLAMCFGANAALTNVYGDSVQDVSTPSDVQAIQLHNNTAASVDTFDAEEVRTYGPYRLTNANGQPMFKGFQLYSKSITGTTPTMQLSYQLLPFHTVADTMAVWTVWDTLTTSGAASYLDLSSTAGQYIMFKIYNYDGTECQIPDYLYVMPKKNTVTNLNR